MDSKLKRQKVDEQHHLSSLLTVFGKLKILLFRPIRLVAILIV